MPPGARTLLDWIALTTSVGTKPKLESLPGASVTSRAGVTVPFAVTFEMPGTCSSAGTRLLVTTAERPAALSDREVTASVTTVA